VPVGSVLYMTATVAYSDSPLIEGWGGEEVRKGGGGGRGKSRIQVRVDTKVRNIEHGEVKGTGQFNYTFEVQKDIKVVPQTYSDFMIFLDARRRAKMNEGMEENERGEEGVMG